MYLETLALISLAILVLILVIENRFHAWAALGEV